MLSFRSICTLALGFFMFPGLVFAQRERGSIVGRITDPSGAVIPSVAIKVTNINTGVEYTTQTTEEGIYNVLTLPIGTYRVEAQKQGFKTALADNIEVGVAQQVTIDLVLQVGEVAEQVTVTSEGPLLDLTSPELGSTMDDKLYHELPNAVSETRDPSAFIFNSLPGLTGNSFLGSINGGQLFSHEVLMDGVTAGRYDVAAGSDTSEFAPPVDAIDEFKLQTGNYSAALGGTQTGIFTLQTKSGTNEIHGNLYEYHRNRALDAAGFNVNTYAPNGIDSNGKAIRGFGTYNNFGGTVGGPIKKNQTFFFVAYDRLHSVTRIAGSPLTSATSDQLQGDFSRFLGPQLNSCGPERNEPCSDAIGRPIFQGTVFDPATTRTVTAGQMDPGTGLVADQSGTIRDAFGFDARTGQPIPGQANVIPQSRWSQVSRNVVPFFASIQRFSENLFRNTTSSGYGGYDPNKQIKYWMAKVDHTINDKHKLSSSFNHNSRPRQFGGVYFGGGPINLDQFQTTEGRVVRMTEDWAISDHMLNSFRFGFNRFHNFLYPAEDIYQQDWASQIGLSGLGPEHFPEIGFGANTFGSCFFGPSDLSQVCGGEAQNYDNVSESWVFVDDMSYTRGRHTFQWGGEARFYRYNDRPQGYNSGQFYFSNAQSALPTFQTPIGGGLYETGWPFASFLLGTVESAYRPIFGTFHGYRQRLYALYFHDDWRATPRLTLNLGLRWDIPTPQKEAHGRFSGFDPTAPNPGADGIPGALVFLQNIGRESFQDSYYRQFGPRFGFAYQLTEKTVLRGGYGIVYMPPIGNTTQGGNTQGFNSEIAVSHGSPDPRFAPAPNPWDPVLQWDNGFPGFTGTLPNTDPAQANFDRGVGSVGWRRLDSLRQPYGQNWSFGIQRELLLDSVLEANYVGNKGTRLVAWLFANHVNAIPARFMAITDASGNALVNKTFGDLTPADLDKLSAAGFRGKPYPSFPNTALVSQALKRFPQHNAVTDRFPNHGSSTYHSLQVTWRKRPSKGLTFIASYTFSKLLTNASEIAATLGSGYLSGASNFIQWSEDRRLERSVADFDIPHSLKLTYSYELPFGQGKRFLNRGGWVDKVLGGWKVTGVQVYNAGYPLTITSFVPAATSTDGGFGGRTKVDLQGDTSSLNPEVGGPLDPFNGTPYLNVPTELTNGCAGPFCAVPTTADGYALRPGNAPRFFGNLRAPGFRSEDLGLIKMIRFTERTNLEIVANFFNAFNRHGFGRPDTFLGSPTFGRIISPANGPRSTQIALRLNF